MWQMLVGVVVGVAIGTYCDCEPYLDKAVAFVKEKMEKISKTKDR